MYASQTIGAWLLSAVASLQAVPKEPHADEVHQHVVDSILQVAYDADEPPVYQGATGRARTALLLANLGGWETHFAANVLMGHCRIDQCDSGLAFGGYQIHPGRFGIRLIGGKAAQCQSVGIDCYRGRDLIDDWTLASRVGLHIWRTNPAQYTTHLKATAGVVQWLSTHPVPVEDSEVLGEVASN